MGLKREEIEAIADRVVELLREEQPGANGHDEHSQLVDAATLARLLGVSRATVYAKADELGAIRLGSGKRARLRFDPGRLVATNGAADSGAGADSSGRRTGPARQRSHSSSRLLQIHPAPRRTTRGRSARKGRS